MAPAVMANRVIWVAGTCEMVRHELRDVVIILPGIMGSVLQKDGIDLWAASCSAAYRGILRGHFSEHLALRREDPEVNDPGNGVRATELVTLPSIFPRFWKSDDYTSLRGMISSAFRTKGDDGKTPGNYYEFPYDWRFDNRIAARRLEALVDRVLPAWRAFTGDRDAKVILIGHSMGGLVGRYYAEALGGWPNCRALITLGTPHRGSLNALEFLSSGPSWPLDWLGPIAKTFPSIYQLLPIYEVIESEGGRGRVAESAGIPGVDCGMAAAALRFHREIEDAVKRNRAETAYREGYKTIPFVGTDQPTSQVSALESCGVVVRRDCPDWLDPLLGGGDGTVPRISATPLELSDDAREYFISEKHGMLQSNPHLLDSLKNLLRQILSRGLGAIRGPDSIGGAPGTPAISLDVGDIHPGGSPIEIRAKLRNDEGAMRELEGVVTSVDSPGTVLRCQLSDIDGEQVWRVEGLPLGVYRVEVRSIKGGQNAPTPVHDLFEVILPEGSGV
jgi:pimeloyl-ACP methyl ester carboxylesterase